MRSEASCQGNFVTHLTSLLSSAPHAMLLTTMLVTLIGYSTATNPIITVRYSADPSAHVWPDNPNRIWIYTSHDLPGATWFTMKDWTVYSSTDMVNWEDHGVVFSLKDSKWAVKYAWAPDALYYNGSYFLVYCGKDKKGKFHSGVAVGSRPQGPFTDMGEPIKGVQDGKDPAVFLDDDGKLYILWGPDKQIYIAELHPDLTSIVPGTKKNLKELEGFEGPWMHKYKGLYYISYPRKEGNGQVMAYVTAKSPTGPFSKRRTIMKKTGSWTNHGSIAQFKGNWYFFFHTAWLSRGNDKRRSVCVEKFEYNPDGSIPLMKPTKQGVGKV